MSHQQLTMDELTERFYAVKEQRDELAQQVNALIESCYYRTRAGKVHWKQGQHFGTSTADDTDPAAFEQAMAAIRHNAGISECDLGGEDEAGSDDPPRKPREEYDPYADLIEANRDQLLRMHQEAVRRVGACLCRATADDGQLSVWHYITVAQKILDALNTYHPMHCESWCGWPEGSEA